VVNEDFADAVWRPGAGWPRGQARRAGNIFDLPCRRSAGRAFLTICSV